MRTEVTDIPRRTWAPFVGAALAALTAGSLVVFSLVAQRTSLDGFPDRRITPSDSVGDPTPSSITIAPADDDEGGSGERVAGATPDTSTASATSLLEVASLNPPAPIASISESAGPTVDPSDDATFTRAAAPTGSFRAEQPLLTRHAGGGDAYEGRGIYAAAWDARHGGKHAHRSHDAKGHGRASKGRDTRSRAKKAKKAKKAKPAGRKATGHHASAGHGNGRGPSGHGNAARSAAPPSRSKPAAHHPAARPSRSSGSPPAHSNGGGNGKSRGRGHKKD